MFGWPSSARVRTWLPYLGISLAAGLGGIAGSFIAVGFRPSFVLSPFDRLVTRHTPGIVVAEAITTFGDGASVLAFGAATVLAIVVLGLLAIPAVYALRAGAPLTSAGLAALLPGGATLLLTGAAGSAIGVSAGVAVVLAGVWLSVPGSAGPVSRPRRGVIGALGTAAGLGVLGLLLGGSRYSSPDGGAGIGTDDIDPAASAALSVAEERSLDVQGLEPLVSTDFYEVDINTVNPILDRQDWSLTITGAVAESVTVDFADLADLPEEQRFVTLRCVGDPLNGDKMDTALWTGVPFEPLLDRAEPHGDFVMLRAEDGYYNEFPIEALRPGLLAYGMNGKPLPRTHGAPARALVPGHWGEINVKWLTEIEVLTRAAEGYWEKRGWHGTGPVNTVAKLWQVNYLGDGTVEVAGHAYAGTRGIRAVEVSTDAGETWQTASLSEPLPGDDVWRQWRHEYVVDRDHEVVVRAIDGAGAIQVPERQDAYPRGATGWVSREIPADPDDVVTETPEYPG